MALTAAMIAIAVLLVLAAIVCLYCVIGVVIMQGVYDKLHYLAPASILGSAFIAAAIMVREGFLSQAGIKSFLVFMVLMISGPVITQAAARAEHTRAAEKSGDDFGEKE